MSSGQNSNLEKELILCKRELAAIKDITAALVSYEFIDLLHLIAEHTQKLLEVETVLIPILNPEQTSYTYYAAVGKNAEEIIGETLSIELGVCGWVWKNRRAWWQGVLKELDENERTRWEQAASNLILTPLIGKHHFLGGIAAMDKKDGSEFDAKELEMLELFSSHVALAIENAQLYTDLQKNNQLLEERVRERTRALQFAQQDLIEQEKMAALGNMVAGVAHEVNTPLGVAVTGITHIAAEVKNIDKQLQQQELTKQKFHEFIEHNTRTTELVRDNLYRAEQLIKSFKLVAVDQNNEIEKRHFNLVEYIDTILLGFRNNFKHQSVTVNNLIDKSIELDSYPGIMAQLISNLTTNALKHAFSDKAQSIITLKSEQQDQFLLLYFIDDGHGISSDNLAHIFEPFYTTRRGKGGSGLGLSICYNLVKNKLQGKITCQSTLGQGTQFTLCIPASTLVSTV